MLRASKKELSELEELKKLLEKEPTNIAEHRERQKLLRKINEQERAKTNTA
jgi:hypothetical protein